MKKLRHAFIGTVMLALIAGPGGFTAIPARAADGDQPITATPAAGPGLIWGPKAREAFEALARDGVVGFEDFEGTPTGLHKRLRLGTPGGDIVVRLRTTQLRYPLPRKRAPAGAPVAVLPYDFVREPANHRLMGVTRVKLGDGKSKFVPDGQSMFELVLSPPVSRVGLMRPWSTYSVTRFYGGDGQLLGEHRNATDHEFVGYVADRPEDHVGRIVFDGVPSQPNDKDNKLYQVGQVDDLYLGNGLSDSTEASDPAAAAETAVLPPPAAEPVQAEESAAEPVQAEESAAEPPVAEPVQAEESAAEPPVAEPVQAEESAAEPQPPSRCRPRSPPPSRQSPSRDRAGPANRPRPRSRPWNCHRCPRSCGTSSPLHLLPEESPQPTPSRSRPCRTTGLAGWRPTSETAGPDSWNQRVRPSRQLSPRGRRRR